MFVSRGSISSFDFEERVREHRISVEFIQDDHIPEH